MELRKANRYHLNVPVVFWWPEADGLSERGCGITQDISSSGVFVLTATPPPLGARIEIDILLPSRGAASPGGRLNGEGFVLRLQRSPMRPVGFAASVQFYQEHPDLPAAYNRVSLNVLQ